jgi:signal recognition particle GTPase
MQQWVLLEGFPSNFPDLLPSVDIHVTVLADAVRRGLEQDIDLVLCDTSGRKYLHRPKSLMVQFIQLTDVKHNNRVLNFVLRDLGCCY